MKNKPSFSGILVLLVFIAPFISFSQSTYNDNTTIIIFDSVSTPTRYHIHYLTGDGLHPIYGIDTSLTGKIIGKNKDEKIFFKLNVIKGVFNGEQKYFFEDGSISEKASFDSGLFVGEDIIYFPDGKIALRGNYKNGVQDGLQVVYWENGNIESTQFIVNGVLKSEINLDENGKLVFEYDSASNYISTDDCFESREKMFVKYNVKKFKNHITLVLFIDSIEYSNFTDTKVLSYTIPIVNESNILKLNDSLFFKVFVSRNYKYGQKYYSWNWDYFRKTGKCLQFIQDSGDTNLYYNSSTTLTQGGSGQGIGSKGEADYFMIYYRYKIE
ncbi:MAG TPA: hypothetical protein VE978_18095 [Chitinophagales bacterium]|nr:hypothetical protein [Chitinophagales bacterium]